MLFNLHWWGWVMLILDLGIWGSIWWSHRKRKKAPNFPLKNTEALIANFSPDVASHVVLKPLIEGLHTWVPIYGLTDEEYEVELDAMARNVMIQIAKKYPLTP